MSPTGIMSTYLPLPVTFERGEGVWLFDTEGKKYLDALGGIAVCGLGHCHPAVTRAISEQAATLVHTSNLYHIGLQEALGHRLCELSGLDACFFSNSGAEANEAAIKIARRYGHNRGIERPVIIVAENSFHGRTLATLSATGSRKVQAGFEPLVEGFVRAPFNDPDALRTIARNNPNVVALLVEPIQGEGGINIPDPQYLNRLREVCDENQWLLMLDEIQTGNGRTGKYFAFQHSSIKPDVITTAKGLGNGMPIGVCIAGGEASTTLQPGNHGSTYGGNPLACAAALAVINTIADEDLCARAKTLGERMLENFQSRLHEVKSVKNIRGMGLMIGIELDKPCGELPQIALDKGLLINVTAGNVIRLLPSMIMTDQEAEMVVTSVCNLIEQWEQK